MSRSTKKGPFVTEKLFRKVQLQEASGRKMPIRTWARACTIVPEFVGYTFQVHNGRHFNDVFVTEDMVGHKLGEFSHTRMVRGHTNKKEGIATTEGAAAPKPGAAAAPAGKGGAKAG